MNKQEARIEDRNFSRLKEMEASEKFRYLSTRDLGMEKPPARTGGS